MNYKNFIDEIPDFPIPGINFKDIQPLLSDPVVLNEVIDIFVTTWKDKDIDKIIALDSRGFLFAPLLATKLNIGVGLIRKSGKLPGAVYQIKYDLEYGSASFELSKSTLTKNDRVLIIDDLIATGGTLEAAISLVEDFAKAKVVGVQTVIELSFLPATETLKNKYPDTEFVSLIQYDE